MRQKKEIVRYRTNPFYTEEEARQMATGTLKSIVRRSARGVTTIATATGEVLGENSLILAQEMEVDTEQFVKLFGDGLGDLLDLEGSARKVVRVVWRQIRLHPNQEQIALHETMAEEYGIPRSTWFKGLMELIEKKIIARHTIPNIYFFDPKLMWNGDRLLFMKRVVRSTDLDKNLSLFSSEQ